MVKPRARYAYFMVQALAVLLLAVAITACGAEQEGAPAESDEAEAASESTGEDTGASESNGSGKVIRMAEFNWTGQWIDNDLATIILEEEMGYKVEKVSVDMTGMWASLASGDLDVAMEIWPSSSHAQIQEYIEKKGDVVKVTDDMGLDGKMGWYVPTYVIEGDSERGIEPMAPDLKNWEQLNQYKDLFATRETGEKGRLLAGAIEWNNHEPERVEQLDLDYEVVWAGSEAAANSSLLSAYQKGEPILLYHWEPHMIHAQVPTTRIRLPAPDSVEGCGEDTFACGYPEDQLFIAAYKGFEEEYPEAYAFLKNFRLSNKEQNKIMNWIDGEEQMDRMEAARRWLEMPENQEKWKKWIPEGSTAEATE